MKFIQQTNINERIKRSLKKLQEKQGESK